MKALDFSIFAIPFILFLRLLLRQRSGIRDAVISQFERDKRIGLRRIMKEAVVFSAIASVFNGYAFFRAGWPYFWLAISIFFLAMAIMLGHSVIYQNYAKQDLPNFPDAISEELISKKITEKKRNRYIWLGFIVVWVYSWRSLFHL